MTQVTPSDIRPLLSKLSDHEVGHRAAMLLSNLSIGQYAAFQRSFDELQRVQVQVALDLVKAMPTKILRELGRFERQFSKGALNREVEDLKEFNTRVLQTRCYAKIPQTLRRLAEHFAERDDLLKTRLERVAEEVEQGLAASVCLLTSLLECQFERVRGDTEAYLEALGEFGEEILSAIQLRETA